MFNLENFAVGKPTLISHLVSFDRNSAHTQDLISWADSIFLNFEHLAQVLADRRRVVNDFIGLTHTPLELANASMVLLNNTDGSGRGEWFPRFVDMIVAQYGTIDCDAAYVFVTDLLAQVRADVSLPTETRDNIKSQLEKYEA